MILSLFFPEMEQAGLRIQIVVDVSFNDYCVFYLKPAHALLSLGSIVFS